MANRQFDQYQLGIQKRRVELFAFVAVPSGTTPVLQKYVYPSLGVGGRTYAAAATASAPLGFPNQNQAGSEGIFSVARTGAGLWTLTLQDKYQRILRVDGGMSIAGGLANIIAVVENPTITDLANTSGTGSVIGIALLSATATLADPTADATTLIRIRLSMQDATEL